MLQVDTSDHRNVKAILQPFSIVADTNAKFQHAVLQYVKQITACTVHHNVTCACTDVNGLDYTNAVIAKTKNQYDHHQTTATHTTSHRNASSVPVYMYKHLYVTYTLQ